SAREVACRSLPLILERTRYLRSVDPLLAAHQRPSVELAFNNPNSVVRRNHGCLPDFSNLSKTPRCLKQLRVESRGQTVKSLHKRWRRSVQQLVGDAVDLSASRRRSLIPAPLLDNLLEWNAVAGSAPCSYHDLWIQLRNCLGSSLLSRIPYEFSSGGFHKLRNPRLGSNDRLPPFLAENSRASFPHNFGANLVDRRLHLLNHEQSLLARSNYARDCGDIGINVIQRPRR